MTKYLLVMMACTALAGCGGEGGGADGYPGSIGEVRERLVNGTYEKGMIKGFSSHNITPKAVSDTDIEWHILSDGGNGIWCTSRLARADEAGTRTRIATECKTQIIGKQTQAALDRIIHSQLTGEPYSKD